MFNATNFFASWDLIHFRKAFITGINGQDGSYLSEYLLENGYEVYGIVRRNSVPENQSNRLEKFNDKINVEYGDLLDLSCLSKNLQLIQPDEIYNLGAQSHVRISFDIPQFTAQGLKDYVALIKWSPYTRDFILWSRMLIKR